MNEILEFCSLCSKKDDKFFGSPLWLLLIGNWTVIVPLWTLENPFFYFSIVQSKITISNVKFYRGGFGIGWPAFVDSFLFRSDFIQLQCGEIHWSPRVAMKVWFLFGKKERVIIFSDVELNISWDQTHYIEVVQGHIFMQQKMTFGLVGNTKKIGGRLWATS